MRLSALLLATTLLIACASGENTVHLVGPGSWAESPVALDAMNQRVEEAAAEYREHAPVPRIALFDIAYPATQTELEATGGYGILLITALSQDLSELPPKRVVVSSHGNEHVLEQLHSTAVIESHSSSVAKVLGEHRWDGLYLYPLILVEDGAVLKMDFAANRNGFVLSHLSTAEIQNLAYAANLNNVSSDPIAARRAALELVAREYPGFVGPAP